MSAGRVVLLAGGSGLVGRALLQRLLADATVGRVLALRRRAGSAWPAHSKLQLLDVDFADLPALPPVDEVFIALGTTIRQAGSQAAFRAVDFDAVLAVARAAQAAGARRLYLVSAMGADAGSAVFYNRVKGEAEQALRALGFDSVVFARPSLLLGDRTALGQPERAGEAWAMRLSRPLGGLLPAAVRPIAADDVAAALIAAARENHSGLRVLSSAAMQGAANASAR